MTNTLAYETVFSTIVKSFIVQVPEKDFAASTKKQINRNETWASSLKLLQL